MYFLEKNNFNIWLQKEYINKKIFDGIEEGLLNSKLILKFKGDYGHTLSL